MKKVLIVVDKSGSAIDRLAQSVKKHNRHLFIDILPFHPKKYSKADLELFEKMAIDADVINFEYWKSAMVLIENFPWLRSKKKILAHHNPYDLHRTDWGDFNK